MHNGTVDSGTAVSRTLANVLADFCWWPQAEMAALRRGCFYDFFVPRNSPVVGCINSLYTLRLFLVQGILLFMTEIQCIASGQVQGVSYRVYVQDAATKLELTGSVQNLPDGTVEIIAQGQPDILKEFIEYLHEGSLMAKVESVSVDWTSPKVTYDEFSVLH